MTTAVAAWRAVRMKTDICLCRSRGTSYVRPGVRETTLSPSGVCCSDSADQPSSHTPNMPMTQLQSCPKCGRAGRRLHASSNERVTYYRCDPCFHLWVIDHPVPGAPPRD